MMGDCLNLMERIPDGSIDMVLCDLPYGTTDCKCDSVIPFEPLWKHYKRIVKQNGAVVLFSTQPFTTALIESNKREFRYCWYWRKNTATGGQFARVQPMRCVEDIAVFYRKKPTYNPQGLKRLDKPRVNKPNLKTDIYHIRSGPSLQTHTNYPKNLLEYSKDKANHHPTQKPIALLEYLVKTYTNEGETVLDNCMGSGSTGVACVNANRNFIGIEMEPKYFGIATERIGEAAVRAQMPRCSEAIENEQT